MTAAVFDALPVPGPLAGLYPERTQQADDRRNPRRGGQSDPHEVARAAEAAQARWRALDDEARGTRLAALREQLRATPFGTDARAEALACAADSCTRTLGMTPRSNQLLAAAAMLDQRLVEMATGEGKTLALACAAAAAGLAGVPVHIVTANDYLARRDAEAMMPLHAGLGLTVGAVHAGVPAAERPGAWRNDVVYCTARELVFDYLRDGLDRPRPHRELAARAAALSGAVAGRTRLRGLCMALIDEADSILLDEAVVPLVVSERVDDPARRASLWRALALARRLAPEADFALDARAGAARLTEAGRRRLEDWCGSLAGSWRIALYREELVATALAALHLYRHGHDYLVRAGKVEIVDPVTGRIARGRVWSRGLHGLVELKEGCRLGSETRTVARITYQRFFPRYHWLAGISGTVRESARELRRTYGVDVLAVPGRAGSRRERWPTRAWPSAAARRDGIVARVWEMRAIGRPVLVGTDSVEESRAVSAALAAAGIPHEVLDASQDREEARVVAGAGQPGAVTVATRMAGRGTDIVLADSVRDLGGLHVVCCQANPARRLDRQLEGRCARQDDPGSCEHWIAPEDPRPGRTSRAARLGRHLYRAAGVPGGSRLLAAGFRVAQRLAELRQSRQRAQACRLDASWARDNVIGRAWE